jgi:hypothetical protein
METKPHILKELSINYVRRVRMWEISGVYIYLINVKEFPYRSGPLK